VALFETAQPEPARDAYRAALRLSPGYQGARWRSPTCFDARRSAGAIAEAEALKPARAAATPCTPRLAAAQAATTRPDYLNEFL
jgi:hypothetical protein